MSFYRFVSLFSVGIVGKHVYGSLYGLEERKAYSDPDFLKQLVIEAAKRANATVLEAKAWKLEGEKGGVSAIVIVLESHIAVHTWKEYEYATVDVYTCGAHTDPWKAWDYIVQVLRPSKVVVHYADRSQL